MNILGLISIPDWLILLVIVLSLIYVYGTWTFSTWAERGIPYVKPLPFIGTLRSTMKEGLHRSDILQVRKYGKFFGAYEGRMPVLVVADPELVKEITVKEALTHFHNRRDAFDEIMGDILQEAVTVKKDEEWKSARSILTPTFTANKMKNMIGLIKESLDPLMAHLDELAVNEKEFEAKELFGSFTLDVIASNVWDTNRLSE